jgi:hypothetical protein
MITINLAEEKYQLLYPPNVSAYSDSSYTQTFFSSRTTNMSDQSSSSSPSSSSDSSSSSDDNSSKAKKYAYSSGNCKKLSKWLITGLKEQEVKKAREAFQPKFKKKEDLLCNPVLDEAF